MGGEVFDLASSWLLTFAIHGTALLAAVALLARSRCLPESIEEVLWRFALVGAIGTASLQLAFGGARLGAVELPTIGGRGVAVDRVGPLATRAAVDRAPVGTQRATAPVDVIGAERSGSIPSGIWLLGIGGGLAALGLARLGARRLALRRLLADRRPLLDGGPCRRSLDALRERIGMRREVRLSVCAEIASPVAFGVIRPEICVPRQALAALGPAARDAMLAHELAHLVRRDPLWLELVHTLSALFPWQPLLRVARRRMRTLAEFRCDELGAQWTGAVDVADCLVEVAGWLRAGRGAAVAEGLAGMTVQREGLEARVDRLLAGGPTAARRPAPASIALGLGLATVLLAAGLPGARAGAPDLERPAGPVVDVSADRSVAPSAASSAANDEPPPGPLLGGLFEPLDAERDALAAEIAALRVDVERHLPDPELEALFAELDRRVLSIDGRRAALAALLTKSPVSPTGVAAPLPSSRR